MLRRLMMALGFGKGKIEAGFHFAGGSRFRYEFRRVTSVIVERHEVQPLIARLTFDSILDEWVRLGTVHVALEYLFAKTIVLRHAENSAFDAQTKAEIDQLVKMSGLTKVSRDGKGFVTFETDDDGAAFAYKAYQILVWGFGCQAR
jgi:hypothetical protein